MPKLSTQTNYLQKVNCEDARAKEAAFILKFHPTTFKSEITQLDLAKQLHDQEKNGEVQETSPSKSYISKQFINEMNVVVKPNRQNYFQNNISFPKTQQIASSSQQDDQTTNNCSTVVSPQRLLKQYHDTILFKSRIQDQLYRRRSRSALASSQSKSVCSLFQFQTSPIPNDTLSITTLLLPTLLQTLTEKKESLKTYIKKRDRLTAQLNHQKKQNQQYQSVLTNLNQQKTHFVNVNVQLEHQIMNLKERVDSIKINMQNCSQNPHQSLSALKSSITGQFQMQFRSEEIHRQLIADKIEEVRRVKQNLLDELVQLNTVKQKLRCKIRHQQMRASQELKIEKQLSKMLTK